MEHFDHIWVILVDQKADNISNIQTAGVIYVRVRLEDQSEFLTPHQTAQRLSLIHI